MRWSEGARAWLAPLLAPLLLLAACADLQPFRGNPGAEARRLARPPAYRIAVPTPTEALLTDAGAERFAETLAEALRAAEVPAAATPVQPLDWPLVVTARREGSRLLPRYELFDADGTSIGVTEGGPAPLRGWGMEEASVFREVAARDAPGVATLLEAVEASRKASDPAALAGRGPLRIRLAGVKGAPGDGNRSLRNRLGEFLTRLGYLPQDQAEGATYAVQAEVQAVPAPGDKQRIELQWIVSRRDGYELGRVVQINEVPRGSLNGLWGDVAYVAAEQAASGIREVLQNAAQPELDEATPPPPPPPEAHRGTRAEAAPAR